MAKRYRVRYWPRSLNDEKPWETQKWEWWWGWRNVGWDPSKEEAVEWIEKALSFYLTRGKVYFDSAAPEQTSEGGELTLETEEK